MTNHNDEWVERVAEAIRKHLHTQWESPEYCGYDCNEIAKAAIAALQLTPESEMKVAEKSEWRERGGDRRVNPETPKYYYDQPPGGKQTNRRTYFKDRRTKVTPQCTHCQGSKADCECEC